MKVKPTLEVHICGLKSRDPKFLAALAAMFKAAHKQFAKVEVCGMCGDFLDAKGYCSSCDAKAK
jgi:hypothetical protein